jgi:Nuclease-related domain/UvrD-like helicase C-terminal domain/AAA domain
VQSTLSQGEKAERLVFDRLRAALPPEYRLYPNVNWIGRTAAHRGLRDGEADLVIAHPDLGILVIEVKSGSLSRDAQGRWGQGKKPSDVSPFEQAKTSRYQLIAKLSDLPAAPPHWNPIAGQAVAFPDVDLASAGPKLRLFGPDIDPDLIFDHAKLVAAQPERTRAAVDRAFELWAGETGRTTAPGQQGIDLIDSILTSPIELRSLLRSEIDEGEPEVVRLTNGQLSVLQQLRRVRRAEIRGGAGTGKTMIALEKARQLAREGFRTLLVCFNQPLARMLRDEVGGNEFLHVSTFHQLCEDLGREAETLPARPEPPPPAWWNETLPAALFRAIETAGARYHAVVVDEGQDFEADWLEALELLLVEPKTDLFYVFHDPAQSFYRNDVVEKLGLSPFDLDLNCRNAQPIHELVARFSQGELAADALRTGGRPPEILEAETPAETIQALRRLLYRLRTDERVRPWEIAVLTGVSLEKSDVWRQRTFGNEVLWNGQVDDAGRPTGRSADQVEPQPDDVILCDSIRRFKGLERPVVILVELSADDPKLNPLLYVGMSRARQHLVLVVPTDVAERLRE